MKNIYWKQINKRKNIKIRKKNHIMKLKSK